MHNQISRCIIIIHVNHLHMTLTTDNSWYHFEILSLLLFFSPNSKYILSTVTNYIPLILPISPNGLKENQNIVILHIYQLQKNLPIILPFFFPSMIKMWKRLLHPQTNSILINQAKWVENPIQDGWLGSCVLTSYKPTTSRLRYIAHHLTNVMASSSRDETGNRRETPDKEPDIKLLQIIKLL